MTRRGMADNSATAARYRVIRIPAGRMRNDHQVPAGSFIARPPARKTTRENRRAANPFGLASRIPDGRFGIIAEAAS
jgi:hypothetical protein